MPADQIVSSQEILAAAGADKPVKGTFLQRTGFVLAGCVGALAIVVTLAILGRWLFSLPAPPVIPSGADAATAKAILENYRTLQQIVTEPYTSFFEMIVVKVLLPIFTSILGYFWLARQRQGRLTAVKVSSISTALLVYAPLK
jgi:hypothetical protein